MGIWSTDRSSTSKNKMLKDRELLSYVDLIPSGTSPLQTFGPPSPLAGARVPNNIVNERILAPASSALPRDHHAALLAAFLNTCRATTISFLISNTGPTHMIPRKGILQKDQRMTICDFKREWNTCARSLH